MDLSKYGRVSGFVEQNVYLILHYSIQRLQVTQILVTTTNMSGTQSGMRLFEP